MEEMLHNSKRNVFICFRSKLGSDQVARKVFDNMDQPGWFKKKLSIATNKVMKDFKTISTIFLKFVIPTLKVFFLTWDMVKDGILWIFLYIAELTSYLPQIELMEIL